ncbi:hypothetical protein [uncultured Phenylobacterium sp.]|uniref:hypothetical protein n=1 Tax=uncultured Phenylobacterium sp. TaxID=349273 RepID=UPI0025EF0EFC|nr:hypothetical protein [uncultured Phenylobacterium sp.]
MSFDIYLVPSSATPDGRAAHAATGRALAACDARWGRSGEADVILSTGEEVEFYGADEGNPGAMFALRGGLTPELARVIFEVADATRCFVTAPLEPPRVLRTPGNAGTLSPDDAEDVGADVIVDVADVRALVAQLSGGLGIWSDYAATVRSGPAAAAGDDDELEDLPEPDPSLLDRFFKRPNPGS